MPLDRHTITRKRNIVNVSFRSRGCHLNPSLGVGTDVRKELAALSVLAADNWNLPGVPRTIARNADANILPEIAAQSHDFRQNETQIRGKLLN